jgi:16S rRNA processing protein RimM
LKSSNNTLSKTDYVLIGKIIGAHGVYGNLKLFSFAESLVIFQAGSSIRVQCPGHAAKNYEISWVKPHSRKALLSLKGIENRPQAEALKGSELYIEKKVLPELDDGSYYWFDLIGLEVFTTDDMCLGRVDSIIETGSNDVYVVKADKKEVLIPAIESVVQTIDLTNKRMLVELPDGWLE